MEHETYRLELVPLSSVRPSKENPRRDFGDIDALADAIRATDGQPFNPIVVGRDGDVYRIADGERRYRAMLQVAGESGRVRAIVCDDITSAHMAVAMLATDDKQQLTETERARGFQTMLSLGVEEQTMARAVRRSVDAVRKAKTVAAEAPEQATFDQMVAASEFEGEDRESVLACSEDGWRSKAAGIRARIMSDMQYEALMAAVCELGVSVYDEKPDGHKPITTVVTADQFRDVCADHAPSELAAWPTSWNKRVLYVGRVAECEAVVETPEERAERELRDRRRAAHEALKKKAASFVCDAYCDELQVLVGRMRTEGYNWARDSLVDRLKGWGMGEEDVSDALRSEASTYETLQRISSNDLDWCDWTTTYLTPLRHDGYELSGDDIWLRDQARDECDRRIAEAAKEAAELEEDEA